MRHVAVYNLIWLVSDVLEYVLIIVCQLKVLGCG